MATMRMGVGNVTRSVSSKRVREEAERAADYFLIRFPKSTVTLTAELEDGTRVEVTRGTLKGGTDRGKAIDAQI
jgi:hypothetical protein